MNSTGQWGRCPCRPETEVSAAFMLKAIFRSPPVQAVLTFLLWAYMGLVRHLIAYDRVNEELVEPVRAAQRGAIGCFWHGRIALALGAWPRNSQPASMLISLSRDGQFVADAVAGHGIGLVRGSAGNPKKRSKSKGGVSAFRAMADFIKGGGMMGVTPDGPRGPRMHASMGAIKLARATGAPIYAFGASARFGHLLDSWDRFFIPYPFGRGAIVWTGPILVPADADDAVLEAKRQELELLLREANYEADRMCGRTVVEPAPAPKLQGRDETDLSATARGRDNAHGASP